MSRAYEKNCCVGISRLCAHAWTLSKKSRSGTFRQLRNVTSSVASRKCQFPHDPSADGSCVVCASSTSQSGATIISFQVEASGEKTKIDKTESSDDLYHRSVHSVDDNQRRQERELRSLKTVSDTRITPVSELAGKLDHPVSLCVKWKMFMRWNGSSTFVSGDAKQQKKPFSFSVSWKRDVFRSSPTFFFSCTPFYITSPEQLFDEQHVPRAIFERLQVVNTSSFYNTRETWSL